MINGNILLVDDNVHVLSSLEVLLQFKYKQVESISNPILSLLIPRCRKRMLCFWI